MAEKASSIRSPLHSSVASAMASLVFLGFSRFLLVNWSGLEGLWKQVGVDLEAATSSVFIQGGGSLSGSEQ